MMFDYEKAFNEVMQIINGSSYTKMEDIPDELVKQFYLDNGIDVEEDDNEDENPKIVWDDQEY